MNPTNYRVSKVFQPKISSTAQTKVVLVEPNIVLATEEILAVTMTPNAFEIPFDKQTKMIEKRI